MKISKVNPTNFKLSQALNDRASIYQTNDGDDEEIIAVKRITVEDPKAFLRSCD